MRFFELLNIQHFVLYLFPAVAFCIIFSVGLAFTYFKGKDSADKEKRVIERFPGGIEGRNAPFPLVLILIIAGTVIWSLAYIVFIGVLGVKI